MRHVPVLLNEVIEALSLKPNQNVIDCTLGDGGHAENILERTSPKGKLLGIDADPEAMFRAKQFLYRFQHRITFVRDNFSNIKKIVDENHWGPVDRILMDLGWSSPQFTERGRGFSFEKNEPLDMRYAPQDKLSSSAADILCTETRQTLANMFRTYGEERLSEEIAQAIILKRKNQSINTTFQLVDIILEIYRKKLQTKKEVPWIGGLHPATKVFQALRIAVNDELSALKNGLRGAINVLSSGGILAVITFHSGEDRIVKHFFRSQTDKTLSLLTKKPITCSAAESQINARALSAKLRVIQKK